MTEDPYNSQGWNRYTYVGNPPLNATDPSGYCWKGCFWQKPFKALGALLRRVPILGNILTIAAAALCGPAAPVCAGIAASVTSAVVTGLASGSLGQALRAGLISAATAFAMFQVGELTGGFSGTLTEARGHGALAFGSDAHLFNIAGHAAVGCGSSVASGGKCGPGALSGAVGSFATPLTRGLGFVPQLVALSTVGGLASVAGGGKFANGATTAAFGYLFNAFAEVLGWAGSRGGAVVGAGLCVEGGPLAIICGIAGATVGRSVGTSIGAAIDGVFWNEVTDIDGSKPPFVGQPGSTVRGQTQTRIYGDDGYPLTDRDQGHPDEKGIGCGDHCQDWGRPAGGGAPTHLDRGPPRLPTPGDPPAPRGPGVPIP